MARQDEMKAVDRLYVLWSSPVVSRRFIVGELWRKDGGYAFGHDLEKAEEVGFAVLPELGQAEHTLDDPLARPYLFSAFAQRIPSPKRPDYREMLARWGVLHPDDPLEVLARSGGVQLTDRLELAEYRASDDDLLRPLQFRIAGTRHFGDAATRLHQGQRVTFQREPTNLHDEHASLVLDDGTAVGYVPRQYSKLVARHLDAGHALDARVTRRLIVPPDRDSWVVEVARRTA